MKFDIESIVQVVLLAFLGFALYTQWMARRKAELEAELLKRRKEMDATKTKLEENKVAYDEADARLGTIPPDMLSELGGFARDRAKITDLNSGAEVPVTHGPPVEPRDTERFFDLGAKGETKLPH